MDHPVALDCAARTEECTRKFFELDFRFFASQREDIQMLSNSRDTIAHSRRLLSGLNGRTAK